MWQCTSDHENWSGFSKNIKEPNENSTFLFLGAAFIQMETKHKINAWWSLVWLFSAQRYSVIIDWQISIFSLFSIPFNRVNYLHRCLYFSFTLKLFKIQFTMTFTQVLTSAFWGYTYLLTYILRVYLQLKKVRI